MLGPNHTKLVLFVAMALLFSCSQEDLTIAKHTSDGAQYKTENVVIVVIDGPRFKETWGDPDKKNIPYFSNELAAVGVHSSQFYNRGATYTTSGHTAITTGYYQWMSNDGSEIPLYPSIFQSWLSHTGSSPKKAQIVTSKMKLQVLSDCTDPAWRGKFNPEINAKDRSDLETMDVLLETMRQHHPRMVLVHFRGPDLHGHAADWSNYLSSIRETDELTFKLWQFIQKDSTYKDRTTLVVTNDHGRHHDTVRDGFVSHGDFCEGCMHINLYATGPDFKSNHVSGTPRESVDLAPTISELMGFEYTYATGSIMWELFDTAP